MTIMHIALDYADERQADIFFGKVLGLKLEKEFILEPDFAKAVFGVKKEVKVKVFSDGKTIFEIFITGIKSKIVFEHICLSVNDIKGLIGKCKKYGMKVLTEKRYSKDYLFIRDVYGYLYEIKEKG